MINAVLLATTPRDPKELINNNNKAFNTLANRYGFEYVLDALYFSQSIEKILVVGPEFVKNIQEGERKLEDIIYDYRKEHSKKEIDVFKEYTNGKPWQIFLANTQNAYELSQAGSKSVLFAPSDIPLAKSKHIDDFVIDCMRHDNVKKNEVYYCIINNKIANAVYPGHMRGGYRLDQGVFRPANLLLVNPPGIRNLEVFAKAFIGTRKLSNLKSKLKLAHYIGYAKALDNLSKYISGKAKMADVEDAIGKAMGANLKLVETKYAELEYDIDDSNDLYEIKRRVEGSVMQRYAKKASSSLS